MNSRSFNPLIHILFKKANLSSAWVAEYSGDAFGNSMVCVAFLASIGFIASLFLKETLNLPTQDTLDEELEGEGKINES